MKKISVEVIESLDLGQGIAVFHGHKEVTSDFEVGVMGHEHPALQVNVGGAKIKYPIFLKVPLSTGQLVIVLPATGAYQTGNPVGLDPGNYLSPIIREKGLIAESRPYISEESVGVMPLPPLKELLGRI